MKDRPLWERFADIVANFPTKRVSPLTISGGEEMQMIKQRGQKVVELLRLRITNQHLFWEIYLDLPVPARRSFWVWLYEDEKEGLAEDVQDEIEGIIEEIDELLPVLQPEKKRLN